MLIRNHCDIIISLKVDLYYDDGSEKHVNLNKNDKVIISYRHNGKKKTISGKIINIRIVSEIDRKPYGILYIDFSEDFQSRQERIATYDIIDLYLDDDSESDNTDNNENNNSNHHKPPHHDEKPNHRPHHHKMTEEDYIRNGINYMKNDNCGCNHK